MGQVVGVQVGDGAVVRETASHVLVFKLKESIWAPDTHVAVVHEAVNQAVHAVVCETVGHDVGVHMGRHTWK